MTRKSVQMRVSRYRLKQSPGRRHSPGIPPLLELGLRPNLAVPLFNCRRWPWVVCYRNNVNTCRWIRNQIKVKGWSWREPVLKWRMCFLLCRCWFWPSWGNEVKAPLYFCGSFNKSHKLNIHCAVLFSCVTKDVGFYQDKSFGAAIMVTCVEEGHTPCARTLVGTVHLLYLKYIKEMLKVNMLQTKKTESC